MGNCNHRTSLRFRASLKMTTASQDLLTLPLQQCIVAFFCLVLLLSAEATATRTCTATDGGIAELVDAHIGVGSSNSTVANGCNTSNIAGWGVSAVTSTSLLFNARYIGAAQRNLVSGQITLGILSAMATGIHKRQPTEAGRRFTADLSRWDTSSATLMSSMYQDSDFNSDLTRWDVARVGSMVRMFTSARSFN